MSYFIVSLFSFGVSQRCNRYLVNTKIIINKTINVSTLTDSSELIDQYKT